MNNRIIFAGVAALSMLALNAASIAKEGDLINFSAMAGLQYNDNLTVSDVDLTSGKGDLGFMLDLGADASIDLGNVSLDGGYDYSSTRNLSETQFNFETHALNGGISYSFMDIDFGLDAGFYHNRLGGDAFLDITSITPSVATMVGDSIYLRGQYSLMDKSFKTAKERSGTSHSIGASAFLFVLEDGYINVGADLLKDKTNSGDFDYDGYALNGGINVPFLDTEFYAKGKYESRSYDSAIGDDSKPRDDSRTSFTAGLTTDLFLLLTLKPEFRINKVSSNLDSAAYTEKVFSISLGIDF